jgi:hypothetical protein
VIVRIAEEAQYELPDDLHDRLNQLDDKTVAAVDEGDPVAFQTSFDALLAFVRSEGKLVEDDDLRGSDVILPPSDLTFAEAGSDFTGEGLVPDPA